MTVFQASGSSKKIITITTDRFIIYVSGKVDNKKFNVINANHNIEAYLEVDSTVNTVVETLNAFDETEVNLTNTMVPSFFEDGTYQIVLEPRTDEKFTIHHADREIRESVITLGTSLLGSFSFNGDIGKTKFVIKKDRAVILTLILEVFPSKLDYLKDYKEILNEVNEEIASMVFDFLGKTFQQTDLKDVTKQTGVEFTAILSSIFSKFETAINHIEKHPKHAVLTTEKIINTEKAKRVSKKTATLLRKKGSLLERRCDGVLMIDTERYAPFKVVEKKKKTTIDIHENQYVKYIIKQILHRIRSIRQSILRQYGITNNYYSCLGQFEKMLCRHQNGFFEGVSDLNGSKSVSLAFKMSLGYKDVFYCFMLLKKGLDISEGLYQITPKKMWHLYEVWCFLKVHRILNDFGFKTEKNGIIEAKDNGITLSLSQGKSSLITYHDKNGKNLELWYNKSYASLPTTTQRPDTVLCLRNMDRSERIYVFDAKYRISIDEKNQVGPMEDDINVMHRYRDAIVSEMSDKHQFKYNTFGAYVMFPYSDEKKFKKHKYYRSIDKVNIGAFPLLPGSTSLLEQHLKKIVNESYIESSAKLPTYDINDDFYQFKNSNVMVVNVLNAEHLHAYLNGNFFHIPLKSLSKVRIGVDYIAFYQPKNGFKEQAGIRFCGKIKKIFKYKRGHCNEIPVKRNNENDDYLRFELEEVFKVGPITPVEYGTVLYIYTTMYLLKNAETFHELHFKSRIEIDLYKILKEISQETKKKIQRRSDHFLLGTTSIEILNRNNLRIDDDILNWDEAICYLRNSVI